ncbi:MAG TPA: hypothetical protein VFZ83_16145 [Acidimicrobiia bacterium]|nr:hypothetical protein [Acidimicrobiia bacterium]
MRRWPRRVVRLGALAALGYAALRLWRATRATVADEAREWEASPFPFPPVPAARHDAPAVAGPGAAWVAPIGGTCPASHPVKVKVASGIFHVPGGANYDRTRPDRCYPDAAAAEADGFRAAKH